MPFEPKPAARQQWRFMGLMSDTQGPSTDERSSHPVNIAKPFAFYKYAMAIAAGVAVLTVLVIWRPWQGQPTGRVQFPETQVPDRKLSPAGAPNPSGRTLVPSLSPEVRVPDLDSRPSAIQALVKAPVTAQPVQPPEELPEKASAPVSNEAPAKAPTETPSINIKYYEYNGSIMSLVVDGSSVSIYYEKPSESAKESGIRKGTIKFTGEKDGLYVRGEAYVHTKNCFGLSFGFHVSGSENADRTLLSLHGRTPRVDYHTCKVVDFQGESASNLEFRLIKPEDIKLSGSGHEQAGQ